MNGNIKLTPRLAAVANFVAPCAVVADIGTDHGCLPVSLVQKNVARRAVAADKNAAPLAAARKTVIAAGLADKIDLRLGYGLQVLAVGEADAICLAGLGGALMADILRADMPVWQAASSLVLQPMNNAARLRRFLYENGWHITDETLAAEGEHIYAVILAEAGKRELPCEVYLTVGECLAAKGGELFLRYVQNIVEQNEKKAVGLSQSRCEEDVANLRETREFIAELRDLL